MLYYNITLKSENNTRDILPAPITNLNLSRAKS